MTTLLCIEVEAGRDDLPVFTVKSGPIHATIEVLKPKLRRWHWWNDSRTYHGVFSRTLMVPVLAIKAEWWRQDKVPLTDLWGGTVKTLQDLDKYLTDMLSGRININYFRMALTKITVAEGTCRHCGRRIIEEPAGGGRWVDPEATGDDEIWRETCDAHDTFVAEHEPADPVFGPVSLDDLKEQQR